MRRRTRLAALSLVLLTSACATAGSISTRVRVTDSSQPSGPVSVAPSAATPNKKSPALTGAPVVVDFEASDDTATTVSVYGHSCPLPCALQLPRGFHPVVSSGRQTFVSFLDVDVAPSRVSLYDRKTPHRLAGAVLLPAGIAIGASMWALAFTCPVSLEGLTCLRANLVAWPVVGFATMSTGIGLLIYAAAHKPPVTVRAR